MITLIFACDEENAIGKDGDLPWRQSSDLQHFKRLTLNRTIVMGRKTWESLPGLLPNRTHLVMSRSLRTDVKTISKEEVLELANHENIFIIGGGEIYRMFIEEAKEVFRTVIHTIVEQADTFAPNPEDFGFYLLRSTFQEATERDMYDMTFEHWLR
jgi:dihydrofolate reductase